MNKTASQPSGEKIDGGGTWGEGPSPFAEIGLPAPPTDKRGPQGPSIQGFVGETGEIPASPASMPDKHGGGAGAQGAAALGKAEADARGLQAEAGGGPRDACAGSPTKMPDGTQPGASRKEAPERPTVHERVCGKGQVHSSLRGRPAKERVGGAAPDGTFAAQKLGAGGSPPQGPAGASARGAEKSLGFGTAHIATGSCAPESPAMTVKMPPRHPALAAAAPRKRPQPSVPAFGARAPLPTRTRADGETLAPRGLSVSQVHLSGPLSRPGPQVPRRDAPAEAPDHALAPDAAPSSARQAISPDGAFGGAKAGAEGGAAIPFAPTAQQAAAQARGGGGGGGPTPAQEFGSNLNKRVETRNGIVKSQAKQAKIERALELEGKKGKRTKAETDEFYALAKELKTAEPASLQKKLDAEKARENELQQEDAKIAAANKKSAKNLSPTEKARALKEAERQRKQDERQREIQERLEEKRKRREERNSKRPDYRATQRAKARRADNKRSKSLAKAKKLAKAAKNPNMSKSARKKAVEKAKKALQKAKEAGKAKIDAMKKAGATKEEIKAEEERQAEENAAMEDEIEEAEAGIDNGVRSEPQPHPCSLPCECNIPCDDGICFCFRWPAGGGDDGGEGGGDGGDDGGGGGGGGGGAEPPDVKVPEGSSVAEPENGDGEDGKKDKEKKPSGGGKGGGAVGPQGGAPQFPEGVYFQAGPDEEDEEQEEEEPKAPKGTEHPTGTPEAPPKEEPPKEEDPKPP